jgi:O-antigen/teichoic acid export membrane protein
MKLIRRISPLKHNVIISTITTLSGQTLLILTGIIAARSLGPEGRGHLALLMLFPTIISQIVLLGLPRSVIHFVAKDANTAHEVINEIKIIIGIQLLLGVLLTYISLHIYMDYYNFQEDLFYFLVLIIPGLFAQQYGQALLQGLHKFSLFNIFRVLPLFIYAMVLLIAYLANSVTLTFIILMWIIINFLLGLLTLFISVKDIFQPIMKTTNTEQKGILNFALKGFIGSFSPLTTLRLDQLVAGFFLSPTSLGIYVVAQAFVNLPQFISVSVSSIIYPVISRETNQQRQYALLQKALISTMLISLGFVLVLFFSVPLLVPLFFGEEFREAILISQILLIGVFFLASRSVLNECLRGIGKPEISTQTEFVVLAVFLFCGIWLIQNYQITGLALSMSISYFVAFFIASTQAISIKKE